MKKLFLILGLCFSFGLLNAQMEDRFSSGHLKHDSKPRLFTRLPQKISADQNLLELAINTTEGQAGNFQFAPGNVFNGRVVSKDHDDKGNMTISFESETTKGYLLTISRVVTPDQGIIYRGMIGGQSFADIFLLEKNTLTGNYEWVKKNLSDLITD